MITCFHGHGQLVMWQLFHLSNVARSILSGTTQFLWTNSKNEQEKTNHYSQWQCEFSHIGSNQRFFENRHTALTWHRITSCYYHTLRKYCVVNDFRQAPIFVILVFSSHCKQHKWWSYVKTFEVQLCLKMPNCTWQQQKYARAEMYLASFVISYKSSNFLIFLETY